MHTGHHLRSSIALLAVLVTLPLSAQGTENAIAAAILFGALVLASVVAGLVISVLYLFKRRSWQRIVVLVFGAVLCFTSLWIGAQPGSSGDMEFLQLLLGGAGVLFLLLGSFLRAKPAEARRSDP